MDRTILTRDYKVDNDSPAETPRDFTGEFTELYDTSDLFKYQRLEDEKWFGSRWKAQRAHLIDKPLCEKGKRFAKYQNNENNFLALSNDVHSWFDALHNVRDGIPFFNLDIKTVAEVADPANDFRYRVDLLVNAYDVESGRMVFPRLKYGSTIVNDLVAETFIYVLNPDDFRVCLQWKKQKIDRIWNFEPAVD